jgi:ABC-type transporter Mla subunit MlaD
MVAGIIAPPAESHMMRHHQERPSIIENPIMKLKLVLAISALIAMPAFAQPQQGGPPPNAPKPTLAQVQKVVQIITGDKVKTQQFCDIEKLELQIAEAEQKQDTQRVEELNKQADDLVDKIGPEYVALMDGLSEIDENSSEGKQITAALDSLDKLCATK